MRSRAERADVRSHRATETVERPRQGLPRLVPRGRRQQRDADGAHDGHEWLRPSLDRNLPYPWFKVTQSASSGPATLSISVVPGSFSAGYTYSGEVLINGSGMRQMMIPVSLSNYATSKAPWGSFDTPASGAANVTGSIPVTGWAMHEVGIKQVDVYRDPVAAEGSGAGLVFIGTAVQVEGARPDIEAAAPHPSNYRAGWGLMVLSNMLPNGGNGTYTLHAMATTSKARSELGTEDSHLTMRRDPAIRRHRHAGSG